MNAYIEEIVGATARRLAVDLPPDWKERLGIPELVISPDGALSADQQLNDAAHTRLVIDRIEEFFGRLL